MKRTCGALALLLLSTLFVVPGMAARDGGPKSGDCHGSTTANAGVGELGAFAGYAPCQMVVPCPGTNRAACRVSVEGSVTGTGSVGLLLSAEDSVIDDCSGPSSCTVGGSIDVAPGSSITIHCDFNQGVATEVAIDCSWSRL